MSKMEKLLDKLEELIREAEEANCPYVGLFSLEELLREYGREVDDK